MVYCGKPSKGCGTCRSRKIRCDQSRPACSQCTKGERECPGYRDELSLMFRDESQQVVQKAKTGTSSRKLRARKGTSSRNASPKGSSRDSLQSGTDTAETVISDFNNTDVLSSQPPRDLWPSLSIIRPSYFPTKDEAVCFFIRYNIWPTSLWMTDKTIGLFVRSGGLPSQQALKSGVVAIGTAMLSHARKSPALKLAAEKEYGSALKFMNAAVSDEQQAKDNETLSAILLLAIFEVITSRVPRNIDNWTNHIRGATALLEMRGLEQLQTPDGLRLFIQLRFQIIISCLQRGAYVPETVVECSKVAMFLRPQKQAYGDRLIRIVASIANLRADIGTKAKTDNADILSTAYSIEAELIAWLAALSPDFQYDTFEGSPNESWARCREMRPYRNQYHVYRDLWLCNTWNQYRSARIIVCEIILCCLRQLSANSSTTTWSNEVRSHCSGIRMTARHLALDMCASIPYHFGAGNAEDSEATFVPDNQTYVGGLIVLWPLFLAGTSEAKDHPLRLWVIECLNKIGHDMGIEQALALVDIMDSQEGFFNEMDQEDSKIVEEALGLGKLTELVG